ncbi:hypothetical protein CLAIMM_10119 isoform 1 [Cladophialophora immunda]|nr:hypothetical protein CLAIMM_10119 isoform 1 [Cladophialophora immunda]
MHKTSKALRMPDLGAVVSRDQESLVARQCDLQTRVRGTMALVSAQTKASLWTLEALGSARANENPGAGQKPAQRTEFRNLCWLDSGGLMTGGRQRTAQPVIDIRGWVVANPPELAGGGQLR